jgi:glyceraldehyde 3-phosphate dehydrogenase
MCGVLGYEEKPLVSTDYINDTRSGIVDALSTMVVDGTHLKARSSVFTPVPVRPRRRGERRSLRTFSRRSSLSAQGPSVSIPTHLDAFQLHP